MVLEPSGPRTEKHGHGAKKAATDNTKVCRYGDARQATAQIHKCANKHTHKVSKTPAALTAVGLKEDEEGEREVRQDDETGV